MQDEMPVTKQPIAIERVADYHAHVYYDADSRAAAEALLEQVGARFEVALGRMHDRPVGPHPRGSCQIAFAPGLFATLIPWLALNRGGLTVFVHPNTGEALEDHRDRALWLGPDEELKLSALT